jgi:hypothetical protein
VNAALVFYGRGHKKILATHATTVEITTETNLTEKGNCILLVGCEVACAHIPEEMKTLMRSSLAEVSFQFEAGGIKDVVRGYGDPALSLSDEISMVLRKSGYVSPRTAAVRCDKSARAINRELVRALRKEAVCRVTLKVRI